MTFEQLLKQSEKEAIKYDKEVEAVKLLLLELSGFDPSTFYLNLKTQVSKTIEEKFLKGFNQYVKEDIPVQHIIGHAYFYGYPYDVSKDVLIPRSETERLVEEVLYLYDAHFNGSRVDVLDLGTGSGCIGLTLALEEEKMNITLSDVSKDALKVAQKNKEKLHAKATLIESDWFDAIKGPFDIIVSNPPYIPNEEVLEAIVKKEPDVALFGGITGIDFYEIILRQVKSYLKSDALIAFEHGYMQKAHIKKLVETYLPEASILQKQDLQGKDRFTFIGIGNIVLND